MTIAALEVEHAYRECEQITRRAAGNFYYGIRLLPRFKRQAMCAVYAFARRVDDIGDDGYGLGSEQQLRSLATQRELLAQLDDPRALDDDPVMTALWHARTRYGLPDDALELLIEGVEHDVRGASYETFDELVWYCRCVAGAVGRLCVAIFSDGTASPESFELADDLGVAMQLTNILRDVVEDRGLGRTYLPAEDLRRFGSPDLAGAVVDPRAVELIAFEATRAREWFDRGLRLISSLDRRSASCVNTMTGIYRRILDRIVEDPGQVLRGRISLSPWEKTWVAARSLATPGSAGQQP